MGASSNHAETEFPVQKQLEAYNARDIDAFMQWWADDCQYYEFPSRLLASGAAEVRERHIARFREPNLHGTLIKRIAVANVVIDQETVTRTFPDGPGEVDVVAIYEVESGRIAKAWFKMGLPRLHPAAEIRRALPSDAPAVRELTRAAYAKWISVIGREPTPMTVDYDARIRDHRIELLRAGGRLAALIELVPEADHLLIENVAVLPALQGQGHGRRLLAHAEAVAASLGLSAMRFYTNPLFAGNVQFYGRLGYKVDREEPYKGGPDGLHEQAASSGQPTRRAAGMTLQGSCLCGAVRYEVDQLDMPIGHRHCVTCREAHAAAYASTAGVMRGHFRWTAGTEKLSGYESSPGKLHRFCSACGTHLLAERPAQPHVILRVATLNDDPGTRPTMHIWTSHDAPWLTDGDNVPRHPEWQPGR